MAVSTNGNLGDALDAANHYYSSKSIIGISGSDSTSYTISTTQDTTDWGNQKLDPYQWVQIQGHPMQIDPYTPSPQQGQGQPYTTPWIAAPDPDFYKSVEPNQKLQDFLNAQALQKLEELEAAPAVEIATVEPRAKRLIRL